MINKIISFSVYNRVVVLVFTGLLILAGILAFEKLPIDAVPDITNVQVQINTPVEGFAPQEIERTITYPIEAAMNGLAGVTEVRSITRFGLSQVTVTFEDHTDIYRARQLVSERLQRTLGSLPKNIQPTLGPVSTGLGEIYHYAVEAEKTATGPERTLQMMELRALQEYFVKPRLLTVKGVAEVNTIGGYEKQFHIQPRPQDMAEYGVHFDEIAEALERTNRNTGGGYVEQTSEQFIVQVVGLLKNEEDIKAVPIRPLESLKTLTISDVADVSLGTELRTGAALVNGHEAVIGTAFMLLGENSRTVSLRVAEKIQEIQKDLPEGYRLIPLYNRSELVNSTLGTVEHNLLLGAFLVIIVLLALVGNVRAAIITAITIPLSLLFTFLIMRWQGISGNLMSLGALDFGIIIDGAVIVLDNCVRFVHDRSRALGRSLTRQELKEAVIEATIEIRKAAGFGELIIVIVFLPIFALTGIEGKMFQPMAATFIFAVIGALILSFTTAPALASLFLSGKAQDKEPWLMKKVRHIYSPVLRWALVRKRLVSLAGLSMIILGGILFSFLGGEFLPRLDEGSFVLQLVRPANINLSQSIELQKVSEDVIKEFPEVSAVFSRIGTAEVATDPMGVNLADTFIMLKDKKEWPKINGSKRDKEGLEKAVMQHLEEEVPGQRILLTQPIEMRFNELMEGTRAAVSVKLFGEDMNTLVSLTKEIAEVIEKVPGAGDVEAEVKSPSPMLRIEPNYAFLHRLGISIQEVLEAVGTGLGGLESGHIYEGVRRFPMVVRLSNENRSDLETIRNLPVGIATNLTAPLKQVATVSFVEDYSSISRESSKRRAAVLINPRGRDTESFVNEAQEKVTQAVKLPEGYYMEWGGNFENLKEAKTRLMILTPLILVIVLLMIYAAFRDFFQTLLIFLGIPLALVGGVLGLMLNGLPFSISAGVGFVALCGIAVLNGVVLISYFNQLRKSGLTPREVVLKGTDVRLRPILMTALVEIFGFLPMMLSTGVGAEVQKPLASVVIGGIVSSTLLTLVVLPTIYAWAANTFGIGKEEGQKNE